MIGFGEWLQSPFGVVVGVIAFLLCLAVAAVGETAWKAYQEHRLWTDRERRLVEEHHRDT
jgi:hypothetical protein